MENEDRINLLGMVEHAMKSLIRENKLSIEDACKLIKWLNKTDPSVSMYTDRMKEVLREWSVNRMKESSLSIRDNEKQYFVLVEEDFLKHTKDF